MVDGWDVEYAAARREEKMKSSEEVHGCTEGDPAQSWCEQ